MKEVQDGVFGYYLGSSPHSFDQSAKSINEMLHLIHHSIVNDENILKGLPVLAENGAEVVLYGTEDTYNPIAEKIFDGLKGNEHNIADIVSMRDRILMMVRDSGHALTMDIQKDADGKYYVSYFIPKICNVDKVNCLPGVRRVAKKEGVSQARETTTGIFSVEGNQDVGAKVLDFIAMVPTDNDIEWNMPE